MRSPNTNWSARPQVTWRHLTLLLLVENTAPAPTMAATPPADTSRRRSPAVSRRRNTEIAATTPRWRSQLPGREWTNVTSFVGTNILSFRQGITFLRTWK